MGTLGVCLMLAAEAYLFIVRPEDDIAGGVFMGLLGIVFFGTIAIFSGRAVRRLEINNQIK